MIDVCQIKFTEPSQCVNKRNTKRKYTQGKLFAIPCRNTLVYPNLELSKFTEPSQCENKRNTKRKYTQGK